MKASLIISAFILPLNLVIVYLMISFGVMELKSFYFLIGVSFVGIFFDILIILFDRT